MAKTKVKASSDVLGGSVTHLLHRALQMALDYHSEAAGSGAVTQRQYTVLAAAAAQDGLTQNDLVRATGIDRSTLADLVARMLVKGLLIRERSATDGRANSVRLSQAGRAALAAGAAPASEADAKLLSALSAKKREGFLKTLTAITSDPEPKAKVKKAKPAKAEKAPKAKAIKVKGDAVKAGKKQKKAKKAKASLAV
jgi:DNA-binding MarR family transcriptional regulator